MLTPVPHSARFKDLLALLFFPLVRGKVGHERGTENREQPPDPRPHGLRGPEPTHKSLNQCPLQGLPQPPSVWIPEDVPRGHVLFP